MQKFTWIFLAMFIVFSVIRIITKQQVTVFVVIFLFCILGFLITSHEMINRGKAYGLKENQVEILGRVSKISESPFGFQVYLQNVSLQGITFNQIIVYTDDTKGLKIGNIIKVTGNIKHFSMARNRGNFDQRDYYMSLGIYVGVSAQKVLITDSDYDGIRHHLEQLKNSIKDRLDKVCNHGVKGIMKVLGNKNTLYEGILLGDKSGMDMELKELYSISGISHVLAISGLHISIIGMFIYSLFRRRFSFGVAATFSVAVVVAFGILSGMGIAAIRAMIMFGLKLLGEVLGRNYDYLTAISLAGMMLLMSNPFVIYNAGFQMSFVAIISIVIVWKKVAYILQLSDEKEIKIRNQRKKGRPDKQSKSNQRSIMCQIKNKLIKSILFSMTISICMNPIVAYHYFALPTYSFLLNMLIVPFMSVVVVSGVFGIAFSYFGVGIARLIIFPGCFTLEMYEKICNIVLKLPFASVIVGKTDIGIVYIYYGLMTLFLFVLEKQRKRFLKNKEKNIAEIPEEGISIKQYLEKKNSKKGGKCFACMLVLLVFILNLTIYYDIPISRLLSERDVLKVDVLDVGQGDGIVIRTPDNQVVTIDGGSTSVKNVGQYRMIPYLKSQGIKAVDYAVMTHADSDHISGLMELMEHSDKNGVKIKNLLLPDIKLRDEAYQQMIATAHEHGIHVLYILKGDYMKFGEIEFHCIHPDIDTVAEDRNDYSTILQLTYKKFNMLFTGDISSKQEEKITDMVKGHCTVLKVAHHGSKYSTSNEFLQQIKPRYSVISVGEHNLYGHPSIDTLERLEQKGSQIVRTDEGGEIRICTDGDRIKVERLIK